MGEYFGSEGRTQWLLEKRGKFGASEDYKLMVDGKGEMFSKGAWSYIEKKFIEMCTEIWEDPKMEFVEPLFWGNNYELAAFNHYQEVTGNVSMRYFGTENPIFLTHTPDSGGSPDGIMGEGTKIHVGLEVKCPLNSARHVFYSKMKDQYDLKDEMPAYYTQCQKLLMITGGSVWHWISFDDRFKNHNKKMKLIEIYPDYKFQEKLEMKIMQAVIERNKMIEEFLNS
jgi:hypothetical protein